MMCKLIEYLIAFLLALSMVSCEIAEEEPEVVPPESLCSVAHLKSLYDGYPYAIVGDLHLLAVVTANDAGGNIYKKLVVEDASGGLEVKLDRTDLFTDFFVGDSVAIYCGGLTLGSYGGVHQLGAAPADGYETSYIARHDIPVHIKHTGGVAPERPVRRMDLDMLDADLVSCFVQFNDVQFVESEVGEKWTDGVVTTNRTLIDRQGNMLTVRTNLAANFANELLPAGSGVIRGVLSWFNGTYQLIVCDLSDVAMYDERF